MIISNKQRKKVNPIEPKIKAVGFSAGVTTVLMWLAGYALPDLMATAPTGLEAAVTGLIATVAGWAKAN
jgi:hypothetical protein